MREGLRPEALQRERALAAQRYRRQNMAIAGLAAVSLIAALAFANHFGGPEAATGILLLYAISLPITGVLLWLGAVLWWGVDCTLLVHGLRVAALNAVTLAAMVLCDGVGMPGIAELAIVLGLMVLILRGLFSMDGPDSIVAALVLYFTPTAIAIVVAVL
jgi:hypothetical protein